MIAPRFLWILLLWGSVWSAALAQRTDHVEVIGNLIEGDFALQAGQLEDAAQRYLSAAALADDAALAERATGVALASGRRDLLRAALARWLLLAPDAAGAHAQALSLALSDGEHESALVEARILLSLPGDAGWKRLLRVLSEATDDARIIARAVLLDLPQEAGMPDQFQSWLAFAGLARRLQDQKASDGFVDEALRRFPDDMGARVLRAARLREAGDVVAARQILVTVLTDSQARSLAPALRRAAAQELADAGDQIHAAELLGTLSRDADDYALRMTWLLSANDATALLAFEQELLALDVAALPLRALVLGHVAEGLEHWTDAERWYRQVDGERAEQAKQRLAWVLHQQGREQEALAVLRALQRDEQGDGERVREAFLMEAQLLARAQRDVEVMQAYQRGLAVFEDDPLLLYSRAIYQERQGRVDQALSDLRHIIDQDGDNAAALNAYGYTLMERRQRYDEARPYLEKAYALDANSAAILDSIGWLRYRMGRVEEAATLLQRAWSRQKDADIAMHLSEVLWQLGRKDDARSLWRDASELAPDHPGLQALREQMQ